MSASLSASLPRIPESLPTVSRRQPTFLVTLPPAGNRRLSEDDFPSILAKGQRFDSGDQSTPQSMDRSDATPDFQRRGSIPGINPRRSRWTVATLHPISSAVSLGISQSRASGGGSGRRWRVFVRVVLARPFGCSNAMGVSILFPFCPWLGQFQFGLQTVGESLET